MDQTVLVKSNRSGEVVIQIKSNQMDQSELKFICWCCDLNQTVVIPWQLKKETSHLFILELCTPINLCCHIIYSAECLLHFIPYLNINNDPVLDLSMQAMSTQLNNQAEWRLMLNCILKFVVANICLSPSAVKGTMACVYNIWRLIWCIASTRAVSYD